MIEFAFDDGFEVERPIEYNELPDHIKPKYNSLLGQYDKIYLEKVYSFGKKHAYEFYCYQDNKLAKKLEYE